MHFVCDILNLLQEIANVERRKTLQHMDNVKKRRSDELYIKWKEMRRNLDKVAEESSKELEKNFREQGWSYQNIFVAFTDDIHLQK